MIDVLIVGAGPTGLALAHECIRHNLSFRIIDQKEGISIHSKALGIHARTLEVFELMGVVDEFLRLGKAVDKFTLHGKNRIIDFSFAKIETRYPYVLILSQSETERILKERIESRGKKIEWQTRLVDIQDDKAIIENRHGEHEVIESKWIIGCDGAHSTTRHLMKIPFRGRKISEIFLLIDVKASELFDHPNIYTNSKGFCLIVPFAEPNTYRLIFPLTSLNEEATSEKIKQLLRERGLKEPLEITEILWTSHFQIQRRIASQFIKRNVILVGDAAHIHSPIGGQGMNTSIQDAFNLVWKLARNQKSLIKTYEIERRPIAKSVLKSTTEATQLLTFSMKHWPSLILFFLNLLIKNEKLRKKMSENLSEIAVNYRKSPIVYQTAKSASGLQAGDRMPDLHLDDGKRLYQIISSPTYHLLLFKEFPELKEKIRTTYGGLIQIHELKCKDWNEPNLIYLIRPDGYIQYQDFLSSSAWRNISLISPNSADRV